MADPKEARVPDIGGYDDVPVIEVLVAVGDTVAKDQGLVTLESDKATMEVPAPFAGTIHELKVKVGDTLSEGGVVALIEAEGDGASSDADAGTTSTSEKPPSDARLADMDAGNRDAAPEASAAAATAKADAGGGSSRQEARVPDIGDYDDVPVIEVLVAVGDIVAKDQGLATLESDKATMEVPSTVAGKVVELKIKVGDAVSEGSVVAIIESEGESAAAPPAQPSAGSDAAKADAAPATNRADRGKESAVAAAKTAAKADPTAQASSTPVAAGSSRPPLRFDADAVMPGKVPYASPAVRLFARELGVDLAQVTGSARGGRIDKSDVQQYVKASLQGGGANTASAAGAGSGNGLSLLPWPKVDFSKFGEIETRPLTRIQKISGANLARNWAMIPHVTQHDDADVTDLEALRVSLNTENERAAKDGRGVKLTMLAFLMKAVVSALKQYPDFNASLDAAGETLTLKKYFHVGFAADTPNGLVVPVIRDVDRKGINEIATESSALAKKARDGKLGPADMSGGCFSISSLGGIGGTSFTPIVNAPEVAILGVSKSAIRPVWDGQQFAPRLLLPLSLSYDHRVIDGASAARFTATLAQLLGDMRRVLL